MARVVSGDKIRIGNAGPGSFSPASLRVHARPPHPRVKCQRCGGIVSVFVLANRALPLRFGPRRLRLCNAEDKRWWVSPHFGVLRPGACLGHARREETRVGSPRFKIHPIPFRTLGCPPPRPSPIWVLRQGGAHPTHIILAGSSPGKRRFHSHKSKSFVHLSSKDHRSLLQNNL